MTNLNLKKCLYFNRELYHFHFCRQADCFVRMLHKYSIRICHFVAHTLKPPFKPAVTVPMYLYSSISTIPFLLKIHMLLLSTHSHDPWWRREFDLPTCGPPAGFSVPLSSSTVTPAGYVHKSMGDNVVSMWVQLKRWCVLWVLQRGNSGDGCHLASTLCTYDLRKGYLFGLCWARVRRVRRRSISSEQLMCGGTVPSILLLPLVSRFLETIDVCIWRMFVLCLL